MSSLFKKLNTLIQAGVNDVLAQVQESAASVPGKRIPRERLGNDIDGEVEQLREQINRALSYEDELSQKIRQVDADISALDRQADDAVAADDEINARYYVERMQRAKQRRAMLMADLDEHRVVTQELITRVNELDATISEARYRRSQAEAEAQPPDTDVSVDRSPGDVDVPEGVRRARDLSQKSGRMLSDVLREARERVEKMGDVAEARHITEPASKQAAAVVEDASIEDDIAARRSRLSAPPKNKKKTPPNDETDA